MKGIISLLLAGFLVTTTEVKEHKPISSPPLHQRLTEDEIAKIKEIRYNTRKKIIELKSKIELKELELKKLLDEEQPNEKEVYSLVKEIGNLRTQIRMEQIKEILEIKKILPAEKQKIFMHHFGKRRIKIQGRKIH